jgi:3-dehydroquinate synthetase
MMNLVPVGCERQPPPERTTCPRADGADRGAVPAIALDKKVVGKAVRWVLLEGIGKPVLRDDVPPDVVERALDEVLG